MENFDTGLLLNKNNIQLHRNWFREMTKLLGIIVQYRYPIKKDYDMYGELDANYSLPEPVGVIYDEHPNQWTMKKLGWVSELDEGLSIIHVPYDLKELQVGSIFVVPAGVDGGEPRMFRVIKMSTIAVYPASVTCEIGPLIKNDFESSQSQDFTRTNFNVLNEEED